MGHVVTRLFGAAAAGAFRKPLTALGLAAIAAALSLGIAARGLELDSSHGELIADADFYRRYRAFVEEFGDDWEDCLVVVEAGTDEPARRRARAFADDLAVRLAADRANVRRVEHRVETGALARAGLHYLAPGALRALAGRLRSAGPALAGLAGAPSVGAALSRLAGEVSSGLEARAGEPAQARPVVELAEALAAASRGEAAEPPGPGAWLPEGVPASLADGYYATADGSLLLVVADPEEEPGALAPTARSLAAIRSHLAVARAAHPGVPAGLTGRPVLNADEMATAFRDTTFTTVVAVVLVAGLFAVSCRGIGPALLVLLVLAAALSWTLGAATLAVGRLNLLSIVFFVVVVGLGVDFPIHLHARDREERAAGTWAGEAVVHAARETGPALLTAAVTTAVAFLAVGLADFRGIRELGLISAMGVLLALGAAVLLWPAYVAIVSRHGAAPPPRVRMPGVGRLAAAAARPRPTL
ncbi:MAG: MMPL family transporter, partial [Planctomycetales bacterium]|nr:MMPL family transporter [Planctomycetales bacterium]